MSKVALITGITGQDGAYLADFLLKKGYAVFGTYRRLSTPNFWRLQYMDIFKKVHLIPSDMIDSDSLYEALFLSKPDEIYNLAAQSYVGASFEQPISAGEISGLGVTRLLEAMRKVCPDAKLYQASSSEMFGDNSYHIQSENTPFHPSSPYAASKLYGYMITEIYKNGYNLFCCNGILFNHESPIRGLEFVTRKITNAVAKIKLGLSDKLILGNLEAKRDWGYAPDYVEAMWLIMQQNNPETFVVASGESYSVREFAKLAFEMVDLNYKNFVISEKQFYRPSEVNQLRGDATKIKNELGWEPKISFSKLVEIMVSEDLERWTRWKKGEHFPWDAYNYPNEDKIVSRSWQMDQ